MSATEIREIPAVRLFVLFITFFISLVLTGFIAIGIGEIGWIGEREKVLITSAIQCLLAFCFPAWFTARFCTPHPDKWLYLNRAPSFWSFLGVVIAFIIVIPALNWLVDWNQNLHLPESMKSVEETLRGWEDANSGIVEKMLSGASPLILTFAVLIVGLLTGFSEELFFRGGLQNILTRSNVAPWVAVWLTAFIFSALHFQFFGFIPRLFMGAFFGYLLIWSRNLWLPIFAHAFNNSIVVLTFNSGMLEQKEIFENVGIAQSDSFPWIALSSFVLFLVFIYFFRTYLTSRKGKQKYG
ncbi:MAG: CPBP family intramembrane metalloprotease [Muribaculaceae bacterium]|nr:CPBP family intramembrane metalloprotease [Muribaculaceae bacterium]